MLIYLKPTWKNAKKKTPNSRSDLQKPQMERACFEPRAAGAGVGNQFGENTKPRALTADHFGPRIRPQIAPDQKDGQSQRRCGLEPAQNAADFDSPRDPPQPHPIDVRPIDIRRARFKRSWRSLPQVEDLSQKETLKKAAIHSPMRLLQLRRALLLSLSAVLAFQPRDFALLAAMRMEIKTRGSRRCDELNGWLQKKKTHGKANAIATAKI